ncbi:hypothetical protein KY334_05755 [Candidatus Woesearchaeota archaeon]|nr:hypothetical protein [Candidatus Woesearchaeota archaeon]
MEEKKENNNEAILTIKMDLNTGKVKSEILNMDIKLVLGLLTSALQYYIGSLNIQEKEKSRIVIPQRRITKPIIK